MRYALQRVVVAVLLAGCGASTPVAESSASCSSPCGGRCGADGRTDEALYRSDTAALIVDEFRGRCIFTCAYLDERRNHMESRVAQIARDLYAVKHCPDPYPERCRHHGAPHADGSPRDIRRYWREAADTELQCLDLDQ